MDRQIRANQTNRMLEQTGFEQIDALRTVNRNNADNAVRDATQLSKAAIEFNATAAGGGFLRSGVGGAAGKLDDIGRVEKAPRNFSNPRFGQEVHNRFEHALLEQTGTKKADWIFRTNPGQKGVDATYRGSKNLGFTHAELKPRSPNGLNEFNGQVDRWQQSGHIRSGENTSLWFYNEQGVIGQGHLAR